MQLPTEVPVMTLSNVILFPQAMLPLYIFEPRYRRMLRDALAGERMFAVAMRRTDRVREVPVPVAGVGLIRACVTHDDGTSHLVLQGLARAELGKAVQTRPYRRHVIKPLSATQEPSVEADALAGKVLELVSERLQLGFQGHATPPLPGLAEAAEADGDAPAVEAFRQVLKQLARQDTPEQLVDLVSATLVPGVRERQVILETRNLEERLRHLIRFLREEISRRRQQKS
ncbi:MAG: LON peptidase substrate-binding domain-containing protein [Verrucomicrobia bacterium]|nr:LON peptidase substrate-binding domain-containing protein [Verrucomicrobiota bacterium]